MKYLFVESDNEKDYGKLIFEDHFDGNKTELWEKVYACKNHMMDYLLEWEEDGERISAEFSLVADNLDNYTVCQMENLIDYDVQKAYGWIKAE